MAVTINVPSQVKTYANLAAFPATGSLKTIYIAEDTNKTYRWTGSVYVEISASGSVTGFVPYTGATDDLNLGANNLIANNIFDGFSSIVASGSLVTLTNDSVPTYVITGSGGQIIKLPDATTLPNGATFYFNNNQSSGAVTINNNSNTLIASVPSGGYTEITLLSNSIAAGSWERHEQAPSNVSWSTNTLDYAGSITSATWNGVAIADNRIASASTWNAKQNALVSGTNIKTLEGQSLLGSGNIDLSKSDVGLGNVDNTADADKPVSTATQTALNAKQNTLVSGTSIKTINSTSLLGSGDVAVQATLVSGTNIKTIEGQSLLGSGNIDLSKADVGLGNVDNTSDANKPISTATQTALNAKQATIFNAKAFGTQSNSVGETQMAQITIPANTFSSTDKLAFFAFFNKVGILNAATIRFKISTSASMPTGTTGQIALYTLANTSLFSKVNREFIISGGTLRGFPFTVSTNNDATVSVTAMSSVSFDTTVTQYFYISVSPSASTTDITYLEGFEIKEL